MVGVDVHVWVPPGFDGYGGYAAPFTSMDMMAYAYSNAAALARASLGAPFTY